MKGTVLAFNIDSERSIISGDDDHRYHFTKEDLANHDMVESGDKVDFEINDGKAKDIFVIKDINAVSNITSSTPAIIYCLFILSGLLPFILSTIGVIIDYIKRGSSETINNDRIAYQQQIKQFWIMIGLSIAGFITLFIIVGWLILIGTYIWWMASSIIGLTKSMK